MASVEVRGGYKYYGRSSDRKIVLNYLNMNVMNGSIYGLLGASGCGKTTLLSCIVGQKSLHEGEITVLGTKVNQNSTTLGPRIGYMPQEIALVDELTIKETIYYFGRIYGMNDERIRERFKILRDLLELPPSEKFIVKLSGGQKRRVSFACALVHEPELVILDEPTVGLDPLLREKIWEFLVETTRASKLAVIITTHYIEEARQANVIGLMRNGILLAEDSPQNIITMFNTATLEEAFLILSQKQGQSEEADATLRRRFPVTNVLQSIEGQEISTNDTKSLHSANEMKFSSEKLRKRNLSFEEKKPPGLRGRLKFTSKPRMKALMTKNVLQLVRQRSGVLLMFLFPILQCTCFYLAIGDNPRHLKLGVVNEEIDNFNDCSNKSLWTTYMNDDETCRLNKISCRYLKEVPLELATLINYKTIDEAYREARKASIIGFIHFASNFTESIEQIRDEGRHAEEGSFLNREIQIKIDMSNQQVGYFLERRLIEIYVDFAQKLMVDCNLPKTLGNIPMRFETPIYGSFDLPFREYAAPGIVMTMIFFLATLVTATVFITDRYDGIWDRTLVAGITTPELLIAHIITQSVIVFVQCLEVLIFVGVFFDTENRGSNCTVMFLLTLTGFAGMLFGLLISIFCNSHTQSNFVATGTFYPMIILCGLLWPLEGMPFFLRRFALILPFTIPSISVRNIMSKGWSILNSQVYIGFLVLTIWIVILFTFCIIGLRRRK